MSELDLTEAIEAVRARINHSHTAGRCWLIDEDLAVIARDAVQVAAPRIAAAAVKSERLRLADIVDGFGDEAAIDYAADILHALAGSIRREAEASDGNRS